MLVVWAQVGDRCAECEDDHIDILQDRPFAWAPYAPGNTDERWAPWANSKVSTGWQTECPGMHVCPIVHGKCMLAGSLLIHIKQVQKLSYDSTCVACKAYMAALKAMKFTLLAALCHGHETPASKAMRCMSSVAPPLLLTTQAVQALLLTCCMHHTVLAMSTGGLPCL